MTKEKAVVYLEALKMIQQVTIKQCKVNCENEDFIKNLNEYVEALDIAIELLNEKIMKKCEKCKFFDSNEDMPFCREHNEFTNKDDQCEYWEEKGKCKTCVFYKPRSLKMHDVGECEVDGSYTHDIDCCEYWRKR